MNPPQNINNELSVPLKNTEKLVYPFCCCYYSINELQFYKFINIWDFIIGIILINQFNGFIGDYVNIILFVISLICLIRYAFNQNYGSCLNKFYANVRLFISFYGLIALIILIYFDIQKLIEMHNVPYYENHADTDLMYKEFENNLESFFFLRTPVLIGNVISIQWSFMFKNVIFNYNADDNDNEMKIKNQEIDIKN